MDCFKTCFKKPLKFPSSEKTENECTEFANSLLRHYYFWSTGTLNLCKSTISNFDDYKDKVKKYHENWHKRLNETECHYKFELVGFNFDDPFSIQKFIKQYGNCETNLSTTESPFQPSPKNIELATSIILDENILNICDPDSKKFCQNFLKNKDLIDKLEQSFSDETNKRLWKNYLAVFSFENIKNMIPEHFHLTMKKYVYYCHPSVNNECEGENF